MQRFEGKSVYNGIAMGPAVVFRRSRQVIKKDIEDPQAELERLRAALETSAGQLTQLYDKAAEQVGQASAAVFEVHRMLLEDEMYLSAIRNIIETEKVNAEYAVALTGDEFSAMFSAMEDEYMNARAADVWDVSSRLVHNLQGDEQAGPQLTQPSVIVARDLSPSETVQLNKEYVLAFVTEQGSINSHTAILARMMNIPAIVSVPFSEEEIQDGECVIVDGFSGVVTFSPDETVQAEAEKTIQRERKKDAKLEHLKGKENITKDGYKIDILANIGSVADIGQVLENDAGGIGLFRSEFLYLERDTFPTEEEQFEIYKQAVERMEGKKVVIRTLDIGADKQAEYFGMEKEENPAMGCRAIRFCLTRPEIFKVQIRALLRAACYGNLSVLYPMIISEDEVSGVQELVEEAKAELEAERVAYRIPEQGIMIETPAAVMISDRLAKMVDFFSIGTNDLIQYTLALDRTNAKLDAFYDAHHEAVLRMIQMVTDYAHAQGKWVGICGELAADEQMTAQFLKMGIDELSVAPAMVLKLRKKIREMCLKDAF